MKIHYKKSAFGQPEKYLSQYFNGLKMFFCTQAALGTQIPICRIRQADAGGITLIISVSRVRVPPFATTRRQLSRLEQEPISPNPCCCRRQPQMPEELQPDKPEAAGSNPVPAAINGRVAQRIERGYFSNPLLHRCRPYFFRLPIRQRKETIMIIWQALAAAFLFLVAYALIAAKRENKRQEHIRTQALPAAQDAVKIHPKMRYQIKMSDGQVFDNVFIIGQIRSEDNPFGGWDGLFVLRLANKRRAFVRQGSVRYILETTPA